MRKPVYALAALFSAVALGLTGCSSTSEGETDTADTAAATTAADTTEETDAASTSDTGADDELVLAIGDFGDTEFDPANGWGTHYEHKVLHSSLLRWGSDMALEGDLAESYEAADTTWTFKLKPDFYFSDGEQVTAEDVVFTYQMLIDDGTSFDMSSINEVRAEGDDTVVFELNAPDTLFAPLAAQIPIVPEHAYDNGYTDGPIGSGPYKIVEHQVGEQILMEANEHYPVEMAYQQLTFLLADEESSIAAAEAGDVDILKVTHNNADRDIADLQRLVLPTVNTMALTMPTEPSGGTGVTVGQEVETGNDVTSDPAIRKALTLGLDRTELVDLVLNGYGKEAWSVADDLPWQLESLEFEDGDVEGAQQILEDAGWVDSNGDGTVDKDGVEAVIPLMVPSNDNTRIDLGETVTVMAEELGIAFEQEHVTWDDIYEEGKTKSVIFALGSLSPKELWDAYATDAIDTAYNNMPNYSNPEVDEHFRAARTSADRDESYELWKEGQAAGANAHPDGDVSMLWLLRIDHIFFLDENVDLGDQPMHGHGHGLQIFMNVEQWS